MKVKCASGSKNMHRSIFCDDLPLDIIQNAMKEINETEENRTEGIRSLKEFMKKKGMIFSDDEVLLAVLRNCKYDIKKSEPKLEKFLRLRQTLGRKLAAIDMKDLEVLLDELKSGALPYREAHERVILFTRPHERITTYETDFILTVLLTKLLFCLSIPMTSLLGITYIGDSSSSSVHMWYSTLKVFRCLVPILTDIPLRIRKIEVVNEHFLVRWVYNTLRPFIPRKIASRVSFLGEGYENLLKHYHPDILPNEFGGNFGPLSDTHYRKKLMDFIQKLKAEHDYQ